jgi:hypothetical protein
LLFASDNRPNYKNVTDYHTPELALRIRVRRLPTPGEFEEYAIDHFRVGQTYVIPSRLASMLILSGIADLVDSHPARAEAADYGQPGFPKRK